MTTTLLAALLVTLTIVGSGGGGGAEAAAARLARPESTLVEEPADVLVSKGEEAVLKCRTDGPATRCKWRLNRTDNPYDLVDVKEFFPKRNGDCSIRIKKVRQTHVGRWVCSVFVSLLHEQLVSRPAAVAMTTEAAFAEQPEDARLPASGRLEHRLACRARHQWEECGWALPGDVEISLSSDTAPAVLAGLPVTFSGDRAAGDCSLTVHRLEPPLAGAWRCFVRAGDGSNTLWSRAARLHLLPASAAATDSVTAGTSEGLLAALLLLLAVAAISAGACVAVYRRRCRQLPRRRLLENPLYGVRNLQLAAAAGAAADAAPPHKTKHLAPVLTAGRRAAPNHYSGAASLKAAAPPHLYDTPKGPVYAVPSSKESYQVPRSSYQMPGTPVPVPAAKPVDNVYEEVRPADTDGGYLTPDAAGI